MTPPAGLLRCRRRPSPRFPVCSQSLAEIPPPMIAAQVASAASVCCSGFVLSPTASVMAPPVTAPSTAPWIRMLVEWSTASRARSASAGVFVSGGGGIVAAAAARMRLSWSLSSLLALRCAAGHVRWRMSAVQLVLAQAMAPTSPSAAPAAAESKLAVSGAGSRYPSSSLAATVAIAAPALQAVANSVISRVSSAEPVPAYRWCITWAISSLVAARLTAAMKMKPVIARSVLRSPVAAAAPRRVAASGAGAAGARCRIAAARRSA